MFWSHPPSFPSPATARAAAERRTTEIISVKTAALLGTQDLGSSGAEDNKERGERGSEESPSSRSMSVPLYHSGTGLFLAGFAVCMVGLLVSDKPYNYLKYFICKKIFSLTVYTYYFISSHI